MGGLDVAVEKASDDEIKNLCTKLPAAKRQKLQEAMKIAASTQMIGNDVILKKTQYLAGFKEDRVASYPTIPMLDARAEFTFDGNIDDVNAKYPELGDAIYNDVKMCSCGKPCAYTLKECNSCGKPLPDEITKSENVFAAFLFGVKLAKRSFPYTISLRRETDDVLVFDDMLQLCPCHLNGIPKKFHIPDWRFLLTCPQKSLELLKTLEDELWEATKPFLADPAFRKVMYRGDFKEEDIRNHIIASFNFPPSQFQMHVQWLVPPLMPFQYNMAVRKNHFHEGRAFPLSYVRKCLELDKPYEVTKDTPIETIIDHFNSLGVDYTKEWFEWYDTIGLGGTEKLQNWNHDDFQYVVEDGKVYNFTVDNREVKLGDAVAGTDATKIQDSDKKILQNYGRPYVEGKPSGSYIQKPLEPKFGEGGFGKWPPS
jgi:hypothetical protein